MKNIRTKSQLKEHYLIERQLADKLRNAAPEERRSLYNSLYEEMYRRVPNNPVLQKKMTSDKQQVIVDKQVRFIKKLSDRETIFLEIGAGDCSLSFKTAELVKQVYAVDVSETVTNAANAPENFMLFISDGTSIPVPKNSINIAYSNQLMEHLHPDDALKQIGNIFASLKAGGCYICITPNRITGPHDISKYFDSIATGFHLKEYTVSELRKLFKAVGFRKVFCFIGARGWYIKVMPFWPIVIENIIQIIPTKIRKIVKKIRLVRILTGIRIIGIK
jgi:SAM-dependent methyltransferase